MMRNARIQSRHPDAISEMRLLSDVGRDQDRERKSRMSGRISLQKLLAISKAVGNRPV